MKRKIKKWALRFTVTGLLIVGLLLIIILNPILTYANKTEHASFTIYHQKPIDSLLYVRLDEAAVLLQKSEFYRHNLKLDICLNDGSVYPTLIRKLRGRAFAWGFYDKVVLQGKMNEKGNYLELNGYKWNLIQLLAHEMTHCVQYDKLGLWKSKPIASIPNWKWEGYAEFIARKNQDQTDLIRNIDRLEQAPKDSWEISFEDGTISPREYYNYWLQVQYCLVVKQMTYDQMLKDKKSETDIKKEMTSWYWSIKQKATLSGTRRT